MSPGQIETACRLDPDHFKFDMERLWWRPTSKNDRPFLLIFTNKGVPLTEYGAMCWWMLQAMRIRYKRWEQRSGDSDEFCDLEILALDTLLSTSASEISPEFITHTYTEWLNAKAGEPEV